MKRTTTDIVSSLLILLFGYTSFSKLLTLYRFSPVLARMPLIGIGAGVPAFAIPLAELGIVLLLLFGWKPGDPLSPLSNHWISKLKIL